MLLACMCAACLWLQLALVCDLNWLTACVWMAILQPVALIRVDRPRLVICIENADVRWQIAVFDFLEDEAEFEIFQLYEYRFFFCG